jgi:hypothetical protein
MLWSIDPALLPTALRYSKGEARHAAYVRQVLENHPDASLRKMLAKTIWQAGWKMPWLNAILEGGTSHPLVKEFEIVGIPRAILVGRDGVILATDADLRGRNLERTLTRVLGK